MLHLRMVAFVAVSLYTSRVVIRALGISDYGLYAAVASIVSMFAFLNTTTGDATQRFLSFAIGRDDLRRQRQTFTIALKLHAVVAAALLVLCETVGLLLLLHLNIPPLRHTAAMAVFQCSVVGALATVIEIPFSACIIAHERMGVYAVLELLSAMLKLLSAIMLTTTSAADRLALYGLLLAGCNIAAATAYALYCRHHFQECRRQASPSTSPETATSEIPTLVREIVDFSGWTLYGNIATSARQGGMSFLINRFLGTAMNAAANIAGTVALVITDFCSNIAAATRPQIVKLYARGDSRGTSALAAQAAKFSLIVMTTVGVPAAIEMPLLLQLWLGADSVPPLTAMIARIALAAGVFTLLSGVLSTVVSATGTVGRLCLLSGSLRLVCIAAIGVVLLLMRERTTDAETIAAVYACMAATEAAVLITTCHEASRVAPPISGLKIAATAVLPVVPAAAGCTLLLGLAQRAMAPGLARLAAEAAASVVLMAAYTFRFVLTGHQRAAVVAAIASRLPQCLRGKQL